jgi:peptidoglycan hydrolase FlgJ
VITIVSSTPVIAGAGANTSATDPRLKPAAHEFEACLMKELLEPMQHDALFDDDEDSPEGSGNALMSFGSEGLAKAISDRGGFGIASKILAHFAAGKPAAGPVGGTDKNFLINGRKV